MTLAHQIERLIELGVPALAGVSPAGFRALADGLADGIDDGIVCVHPALVPPSRLAPLLHHDGKPGFVVEDMTDLDDFAPIESVHVPEGPLYVIRDAVGGDDLVDWTPNAALPDLLSRARSPLTISEGICWLLQEPSRLAAPFFMCIGSRRVAARGVDARTPAIWLSRGTGRDGRERRNAPKVGWCWAGNNHSWLGFASTACRA